MTIRPLIVTALLAFAALVHGQKTLEHGQFAVAFQADNAWLPASIRWVPGDVELLAPRTGLHLSFTSFEFRTKIYRDENKETWVGKAEPRFLTDAQGATMKPVRRGEAAGIQVDYESSYARVSRVLLVHDKEPRLTLEYTLEMTRDVVVHESQFLGVGLSLDAGFDRLLVYDVRAREPVLLTASGLKGARHSSSVLHAGPALFTNTAKKASVVVSDSHSGDVPEPAPVKLMKIGKGGKLVLTTELLVGPEGDAALAQAMQEKLRAMRPEQKPFALVRAADVLAQQKKARDAEEALLLAAELNSDYAAPWYNLAALREGDAKQLAFNEAAWRMPYNYGYILSGIGLDRIAGLTEEQRRTHIFNVLIAVENTAFYADYYIWAARHFVAMKMYAQACAMYRQALWAIEHTPRPEAYKERYRQEFRKQISALEAKMLNQTNTDLPALIPVRPAPPQPAGGQ